MIKKSTGKNLFNADSFNKTDKTYISGGITSTILNGNISCNGTATSTSFGIGSSDYTFDLKLKSNTNYVFSRTNDISERLYIRLYNVDKSQYQDVQIVANSASTSFTTNFEVSSCYLFMAGHSNGNNISINSFGVMIEEGSTVSEYEPYGKVWYKKKYIEKLVLDGSETNWYNLNLTFYLEGTYPQTLNALCSHFTKQPNAQWTSSDTTYRGKFTMANVANQIKFMHTDENITTVAQWKTWLSTHNTSVYYVLANPTYTIITEQALINQLESIKYSMEDTTIITQTNEDNPFELDVEALTNISKLTVLTQAEYNALTPDSNTIYIVKG